MINFEGAAARPLGERRLKRTPLRDVAGMLRSFDYAGRHGLMRGLERVLRPSDVPKLEPWAQYWGRWASVAYLRGYLQMAKGAPFVPPDPEDLNTLLQALLME